MIERMFQRITVKRATLPNMGINVRPFSSTWPLQNVVERDMCVFFTCKGATYYTIEQFTKDFITMKECAFFW